MDNPITSDMLVWLMQDIMQQDAADEGASTLDADDGEHKNAVRANIDADSYILKGRRPNSPPKYVWVTWRDKDLFLEKNLILPDENNRKS